MEEQSKPRNKSQEYLNKQDLNSSRKQRKKSIIFMIDFI